MARKAYYTIIILVVSNWTYCQEWRPLLGDTSVWNSGLRALEIYGDSLIIGGDIGAVNDIPSYGTCAWYDETFLPFGTSETGIFNLEDIEMYQNNLVVGGSFLYEPIEWTQYQALAQWNGSEWIGMNNLNADTDGHINTMITYHDTLFVSGGTGLIGGTEIEFVGAWDGENWLNPGGILPSSFRDFVIYNDTLIGGGAAVYGNDDYEIANGILYWDQDTTWHSFEGGVGGNIFTMVVDSVENNLYVGGYFLQVGEEAVPANCIARWDGEEWSELESGLLINNDVHSLGMYRNQLYASGHFEYIVRGNDTIHVNHVMRFDGAQWQEMDGGLDGLAFDMIEYQDELYLAGTIHWVGPDSIPVNDIVRWYMHPDSVTWGVNIEELDLEINQRGFNLYPNPNDGEFYVEFDDQIVSSGNLIITDFQGRQVAVEAIQNRRKVALNLNDIPSGAYICSWVEGGVIVGSRRLVLNRN